MKGDGGELDTLYLVADRASTLNEPSPSKSPANHAMSISDSTSNKGISVSVIFNLLFLNVWTISYPLPKRKF